MWYSLSVCSVCRANKINITTLNILSMSRLYIIATVKCLNIASRHEIHLWSTSWSVSDISKPLPIRVNLYLNFLHKTTHSTRYVYVIQNDRVAAEVELYIRVVYA